VTQTDTSINVQLNPNGEILINGEAVADLAAVQAVIADNASKADVPKLNIVGGPEHVVEVGKLVSGAHWAGYPGDKIQARAWDV